MAQAVQECSVRLEHGTQWTWGASTPTKWTPRFLQREQADLQLHGDPLLHSSHGHVVVAAL